MNIGAVSVDVLNDGFWRVDGGAMFGVVPRPMWERKLPPDEYNRVAMAARCLLVRDGNTIVLIDTGLGDKLTSKQIEQFDVRRDVGLVNRLAAHGLSPADVDIVVDTHLHFDHAGGNTKVQDGSVVPTFPRAEYWIQQREWYDATHPNERTRSTYLPENLLPIESSRQIRFLDGPAEITASVQWVMAPGHTPGHTCVVVESGQSSTVFTVDVCPFRSHLERLAWVPGVDLEPLVSMETKRLLIADVLKHNRLVIFDHDPLVVAARLTGTVDRWEVEVVEQETADGNDRWSGERDRS